jgi:hypothetical protein
MWYEGRDGWIASGKEKWVDVIIVDVDSRQIGSYANTCLGKVFVLSINAWEILLLYG